VAHHDYLESVADPELIRDVVGRGLAHDDSCCGEIATNPSIWIKKLAAE
jgi:hypothetical protein